MAFVPRAAKLVGLPDSNLISALNIPTSKSIPVKRNLPLCQLAPLFIAFILSFFIPSRAVADPATTIPADNPIPRQHGWLKECEDRIAAAQGKKIDILFIGDSITQNFVEKTTPAVFWVGSTVWDKHYGDKNVLNIGVGSDGTEHILYRMDHEDIQNFSPKVIVLLAGVNDMQYSPEDIAAGTRAVLDKCRSMYPLAKIILMAVLPNGRDPAKTAAVNQITRTFADHQDIFYLDLTPFMPPVGDNWKGLGPDHIHLLPEGYEIWASHLDPLLNKLLTHN
jgi:beta-glucosidase